MDCRVAIGADHGGFELKEALKKALGKEGCALLDVGTTSSEACDYPDFSFQAAEAVGTGKCDKGILLCKSGIGMAIAANKVKGVRAAVCHTTSEAELSRRHNDANVLVLGATSLAPDDALEICRVWLTTDFEGGRHTRRVDKIKSYESQQ